VETARAVEIYKGGLAAASSDDFHKLFESDKTFRFTVTTDPTTATQL
jgi:hypothetical protein